MTSFAPFGGLILFAITVTFVFLTSAIGQKLVRISKWIIALISAVLIVFTGLFSGLFLPKIEIYGAALMVWLSVLGSFLISMFSTED